MRYLKIAIIAVLSLIGLAAAGLYFVMWTLAGGPCLTEKLEELPSPDGRYVAAAYVPNCHATVRYITAVTLRKAGEPLDLDQRSAVLSFYGKNTIDVAWGTKNDLHIRFPASAQTFNQQDHWGEINILYVRN